MYKHVEKRDCPQPKGMRVFLCAQWILKDSLLQTIKLRSGLCRLALLNKHAPAPPTQAQEWQWIDLYLQKWGSNTTQPHRGGWWPLLQQHRLSLFSWHSITPPPPSLFFLLLPSFLSSSNTLSHSPILPSPQRALLFPLFKQYTPSSSEPV